MLGENGDYKIDEASFKAMWMLGTSVDYQVVLKHFAYLGYSITQGHNLSKYNSLSSRSLLHVSIFGQNGSGKVLPQQYCVLIDIKNQINYMIKLIVSTHFYRVI